MRTGMRTGTRILTAILLVSCVAFSNVTAIGQSLSQNSPEQVIQLLPKTYFENDQVINVTGTLTGEGVLFKNNSYTITCEKERRACIAQSLPIGFESGGRIGRAN
jgi:hypothetical protein